MRTVIPKYQSTVRIALYLIAAASMSHPARAQDTSTATASNKYATAQKVVSSVNLFEDKSRSTYTVPPQTGSQGFAMRSYETAKKVAEIKRKLPGVLLKISSAREKIRLNPNDTADAKALEPLRSILRVHYRSLQNLQGKLSETVDEMLRPQADVFAVVGTTVEVGSRVPPIYASSLVVTSNSLGLDLAYQHLYGDSRTVQGVRFRPTGDTFAARFDPTHAVTRDAASQFAGKRDLLLRPLDNFVKSPQGEYRPSDSEIALNRQLYDSLASLSSARPLDLINSLSQFEEATIAFSTYVNRLADNLIPTTNNPEGNNKLDESIEIYAARYLRNARQVRAAVLGGFANFTDIGTVTHTGLTVSKLFRLGKPLDDALADSAKDPDAGSALFVGANVEAIWSSPYLAARLLTQHSESGVSFVASVAWQDRFPHFVKETYKRDDGSKYVEWYFKRWTQQYGVEYSPSNDVQPGDYFGLYARLRTDRVEWNGTVGVQAHQGTAMRLGIRYFIY